MDVGSVDKGVNTIERIALSPQAGLILFIIAIIGVSWAVYKVIKFLGANHLTQQKAIIDAHKEQISKLEEIHAEQRAEMKQEKTQLIGIIETQANALDHFREALDEITGTQKKLQLNFEDLTKRLDIWEEIQRRDFITVRPEHFERGRT